MTGSAQEKQGKRVFPPLVGEGPCAELSKASAWKPLLNTRGQEPAGAHMAPAGAQREGLCHRASQAAAVQIAAGRAAAARSPSGPATWGEAGRPLWLSAPGAPGCRSCCLKPTSRARQPLAPGWATAGELLSGQPPPASAGGCALTGKRFLFEEEQSWFAVAGVCHLNAEWDARAAQLGGLWLSGGVRRTFPWLSSALLHMPLLGTFQFSLNQLNTVGQGKMPPW